MHKVFITGCDGYIGHALVAHLHAEGGYEIAGIDNMGRRKWVEESMGKSIIPIGSMVSRGRFYGAELRYIDTRSQYDLTEFLEEFQPDTIVHLGEQPSAPYSMANADNAMETQEGNVIGTLSLLWAMREACPNAHLVAISTMGVYGTPPCDIPEDLFPADSEWHEFTTASPDTWSHGNLSGLPFPKSPGSFYHLSKVHNGHNYIFASKVWDFNITNVMQGVVYGTSIPSMDMSFLESHTRFDVDQNFGTAINRFVAQALVGIPITVYGAGGQTRGYLPLIDCVRTLQILIDKPATGYRPVNQFENTYSVNDLANLVRDVANNHGIPVEISHIDNPRMEAEAHEYTPAHDTLFDLGYEPTTDMKQQLGVMFSDLKPYVNRIDDIKHAIFPTTTWKGTK